MSPGHFNQAMKDCDEVIRLEPDDPSAYSDRANAHYSGGEYEPAIADYTKVIKTCAQ